MVTIFLPLCVYEGFSTRSSAANFAVPGQILPNLEPIRQFWVILVKCNCKNEEYPNKNEGVEVVTRMSPL